MQGIGVEPHKRPIAVQKTRTDVSTAIILRPLDHFPFWLKVLGAGTIVLVERIPPIATMRRETGLTKATLETRVLEEIGTLCPRSSHRTRYRKEEQAT
jgi:hypothetical protein